MNVLIGALVGIAMAWVLATLLVAVIQTIHWQIIPWAYKRLTGEAHARSND